MNEPRFLSLDTAGLNDGDALVYDAATHSIVGGVSNNGGAGSGFNAAFYYVKTECDGLFRRVDVSLGFSELVEVPTTLAGYGITDAASAKGALIAPVSSGTVALTVKGAIGQTGNLQEWRGASDTLLGYFSPQRELIVKDDAPTGEHYLIAGEANYGRKFGLYIEASGLEGGFKADSVFQFKAPNGFVFQNPNGNTILLGGNVVNDPAIALYPITQNLRSSIYSYNPILQLGILDVLQSRTLYVAYDKMGVGTLTPTSRVTVKGGDIELEDAANGVILHSPDGTRHKFTVDDAGTLTSDLADICPDPRRQLRIFEDFVSGINGTIFRANTEYGGNGERLERANQFTSPQPSDALGIVGLGLDGAGAGAYLSIYTDTCFFSSAGAISVEARLRVDALSSASNLVKFRFGFGNGLLDVAPSNSYGWFEYDASVSPNWLLNTANNSQSATAFTENPVTTNFVKLRIEVPENATEITFMIDDVFAGSIGFNVAAPDVFHRCNLAATMVSNGITNHQFAIIDYIEIIQDCAFSR